MFEVGDKIICIDASNSNGKLKLGDTYTVDKKTSVCSILSIEEPSCLWCTSRFRSLRELKLKKILK